MSASRPDWWLLCGESGPPWAALMCPIESGCVPSKRSVTRPTAWAMASTVSCVPQAWARSTRRHPAPSGICTPFTSSPALGLPIDMGPSEAGASRRARSNAASSRPRAPGRVAGPTGVAATSPSSSGSSSSASTVSSVGASAGAPGSAFAPSVSGATGAGAGAMGVLGTRNGGGAGNRGAAQAASPSAATPVRSARAAMAETLAGRRPGRQYGEPDGACHHGSSRVAKAR